MSDRLAHNDEMITMHERTEIFWRNHNAEFDEKVWPIFQRHGYSKDAALTCWLIGKIHDRLDHIEDMIQAEVE